MMLRFHKLLLIVAFRIFSVLPAEMIADVGHTATRVLQIGLTGSIGMGKSAVARQLRFLGFPVFDADAAVHELYSKNGKAVEPISKHFPEAIVDHAVNRGILASKVLGDSTSLHLLESIVHPLVAKERLAFFEKASKQGNLFVVYDIPLLLEYPEKHNVDYVIVVSASAATQRNRVLMRPGMTVEKFESILAKQMPDSEKRKRADFIIDTDSKGYAASRSQVASIIESILEKNPDIWGRWKKRENLSLSLNDKSEKIRSAFELVIFDLDDTLLPYKTPIQEALRELASFLESRLPLTAQRTLDGRLSQLMSSVASENALIAHDLTEVRGEALRQLARECGEEASDELIEEAIQVFVARRSNVTPHLYADVLPCLRWFRSLGIRTGVLTNGNANLQLAAELPKLLSFSLSASNVGAMKPSPVAFIAAAQQPQVDLMTESAASANSFESSSCGTNASSPVSPARVLVIGDSLEKDTVGAKAAGMRSAWLRRPEQTGYTWDCDAFADAEETPDIILSSLEPDELEKKILAFLDPT